MLFGISILKSLFFFFFRYFPPQVLSINRLRYAHFIVGGYKMQSLFRNNQAQYRDHKRSKH